MSKIYAIQVDWYTRKDGKLEYFDTYVCQRAYNSLMDAIHYIESECSTVTETPNGWKGIQDDGDFHYIYKIRELDVEGDK